MIPYNPQPYQLEIHNSLKRFRVVKIGRRGGKTEIAINETIKKSVQSPGLYWCVAPTYKQAKQINWTRLKSLLKADTDWKYNEQELSAYHPIINTRIELKGADSEDSLRGVGLNGVILDECAIIKSNVWPEIIRPMLADRQGWALFISTPKGKNWFYDIFIREGEDWQSWEYSTSINKYIQPIEIENAKKDMSERLYRQEFLAEFLDEESGVFRKIRQCVVGGYEEPVLGRYYILGADLAKTEDFTVITVIDSVTRHVVYKDRFNQISWTDQKLKIQYIAAKYNNALCVIDSSGIGDPIVEDLQNSGVSLYYEDDKPGFKFTNESKNRLIDQLSIAIEQRLITFPNDSTLLEELRNYEYTLTKEGRIKYNAPEGKHDDCVISLALAVWGLRSQLHEAQRLQDAAVLEYSDRQGQGIKVSPLPEYEFHGTFGGYT